MAWIRTLLPRKIRVVGGEGKIRMVVRGMPHGIPGGIGEQQRPRVAFVLAPIQARTRGVDDVRIVWIEGVGRQPAQVEHAPGVAIVVGDVAAGHVAALDDDAGVVRADFRIELTAATSRADDLPGVVARGGTILSHRLLLHRYDSLRIRQQGNASQVRPAPLRA